VSSTWEVARTGRQPSASDSIALTAASVFAAETCTDMIGALFRYGGGRLLARSERMQRLLRDVVAARQHIGLSEEAYVLNFDGDRAFVTHRPQRNTRAAHALEIYANAYN
jgi:alkylation response protein AidB-like acyl-CoA dehydrogenase